MELYVVAHGHNDSLRRWENDLSAQFLPVYKNGKPYIKDGQQQFRRLLVAPVQLYKICFAKEDLDPVLNMVSPNDYVLKRYRIIRKIAAGLRKFLGLKPVPQAKRPNPFLQPNQVDKAVGITPIGIKPDEIDKNGFEQI